MLLTVSTFMDFEDYCKVCEKYDVIEMKLEEYKKIRHTILDVEAVDKREKEWREQREKEEVK